MIDSLISEAIECPEISILTKENIETLIFDIDSFLFNKTEVKQHFLFTECNLDMTMAIYYNLKGVLFFLIQKLGDAQISFNLALSLTPMYKDAMDNLVYTINHIKLLKS